MNLFRADGINLVNPINKVNRKINMNVNSFNERLRSRRMGLGMQGKDLAERLGVSAAYVTQLEKGKRVPSGGMLTQLAEILNVPVDWLLTGKQVMNSTNISYQSKDGIPIEKTFICHVCPKKDGLIEHLTKRVSELETQLNRANGLLDVFIQKNRMKEK